MGHGCDLALHCLEKLTRKTPKKKNNKTRLGPKGHTRAFICLRRPNAKIIFFILHKEEVGIC
jgi:hypothetical protein